MTTIILTIRLEDSGSSVEPIVSAGWMYRVRNSLPYTNGSGELVDAAWPATGGWKKWEGAAATLDLDPLAPDNPYLLEVRRPGDPTSLDPAMRLPTTVQEYRQVVSATTNGTSWWNLTRVSGPGPDGTTYPVSGYSELQAQIAGLQSQIDALVTSGGGASTLAAISDMSANARTFNAAANYAAMRTALGAGTSNLAIGTTSTTAAAGDAVVRLTGDQSVAGVKTFASAPVVPDASFVQAKVTNLVSDLTAIDGRLDALEAGAAPVITVDPVDSDILVVTVA